MKIQIKGVYLSYNSISALKDVNMEIEDREVVSIIGPNGSGKSTLLKCINKILNPQKGTVLIEGKRLDDFKLKDLALVLGYVPQTSNHTLPSTIFDTVLLGRRPFVNWITSDRDKEIVIKLLRLMKLEDMIFRQFNELSGGEQQRVIIARALAQEPEVLLLDEPTSNLDLRHQLEILGLVTSIVKKGDISAMMAIHDLNLASRFSDKIILLNKGRVYATGEPKEVLTPENIKEVYGVETIINNNSGGLHIIPTKVFERGGI